MPPEKAIESACKFLGYDFRRDPCRWQARKQITQADVPHTDDGLRILAADGSWSEVILLAAKLEETAVKNANFRIMNSNEGTLLQSATHTAELVARLPYILAQITSHFKMQRVEKAKELLDTLGDIEGDAFLDPITHANLAPFSLRFISSLIPFYMSNPMEALKRLYKLLDEHENYGPDSFSSLSTNARRTREQRVKRIQRALIHIYYSTGKFELAIRTFQRMIEWDELEVNMIAKKKCWSQSKRIKNALQLQQFACLCLHCGDRVVSEKAFNIIAMISGENSSSSFLSENYGKINNVETNNGNISEASLYAHITNMNEGFKLIVSGKFGEAAACFRSIAHCISSNMKDYSYQASLDPKAKNCSMIDALNGAVLQQLKSNAQTSHCTSLLYCSHEDKGSETFMTEVRDTLERYLREDPSLLTQSDAFLSDLVRVYALCGERKEKLEQLARLLEVFRCDAASLPSLEKMV